MSHQPYEAWLVAQDALTPEQSSGLQAHLAECGVCASMAVALGEVDAVLRGAEALRPAPGFTARWQARARQVEERRSARQAWLALGLAFSLTAALTAVLVLGILASPGDLAARALRTLAGEVADAALAWNLLGAVFGSLPEPLSTASGVGLALGGMLVLVGLAAVWFITVHRFAFPAHREGVRR